MIYEFRVRGHLGRTVLHAFAGLHAETDGEDTLLKGAMRDQAALHGVLAQIEALGVELVEVRRQHVLPGLEREAAKQKDYLQTGDWDRED